MLSLTHFYFRLGLCLLSTIWLSSAQAGRPLVVDDAAVVPESACQIESWYERADDAQARWLNVGCNPSTHTELSLGVARLQMLDESNATANSWQIKQLLRPYDERSTGYALAAGSQRVRRANNSESFVQGISTTPLKGEQQLLHLNLGLVRQHKNTGVKTRPSFGAAYDVSVGTNTRAVLESNSLIGERPNWQLGIAHELVPGHIQLDASLGSAYGDWRESRQFTVGVVFVSAALLRK